MREQIMAIIIYFQSISLNKQDSCCQYQGREPTNLTLISILFPMNYGIKKYRIYADIFCNWCVNHVNKFDEVSYFPYMLVCGNYGKKILKI